MNRPGAAEASGAHHLPNTDEGAPADGSAVPRPSLSQSMQLRWRRLQRSPVLPIVATAVVALILGVLAGRVSAPTFDDTAVVVVRNDIVPLVVDADALWTAGSGDLPAVGSQLQELRRSGDVEVVAPYIDLWLEEYDAVLRRIVGVEVQPMARPVQRQFVAAVTLTRDAVEVLAAAVGVSDPATRRDLTSEALRLRIRAEGLTQAAQASLRDLQASPTTGVSEPQPLPSLAELR